MKYFAHYSIKLKKMHIKEDGKRKSLCGVVVNKTPHDLKIWGNQALKKTSYCEKCSEIYRRKRNEK